MEEKCIRPNIVPIYYLSNLFQNEICSVSPRLRYAHSNAENATRETEKKHTASPNEESRLSTSHIVLHFNRRMPGIISKRAPNRYYFLSYAKPF